MEMGKTLAVMEFVTFEGTAPAEPTVPVAPVEEQPVTVPVEEPELVPAP